MARIDVFENHHARVVAQPPVELSVPDVEGDDLPRAALQQHVGEAASRRADVERVPAGDVDAERLERVGQLQAAAADIRMIRRRQGDLGILGDGEARLG